MASIDSPEVQLRPHPSMRRVWLALSIASLGWGTAGVATRVVLDEASDRTLPPHCARRSPPSWC